LKSNPAAVPARSIILAKPAVENGALRSLVKTNGDGGGRFRDRWVPTAYGPVLQRVNVCY
jgi:hypothetical protein